MNQSSLEMNVDLLLPDVLALWEWLVNPSTHFTTVALSALIVCFLCFVTIYFLIRVLLWFRKARKDISFLKNLTAGLKPDGLMAERYSILEKARSRPRIGALWNEFDETLVAAPGGTDLWNTLDAAYFFNAHTLASGLTDSRLISAVPGFLTAIGVIGTFAGLQLGLSGLNVQASAVAETAGQIQLLIGSAAVAFLTSVWGVGTSVVFNYLEKQAEQRLREDIGQIQAHLDTLFPRIRPEQKLLEIADHQRIAKESLQGLAEQIGDRMQQAIGQMSRDVTNGIAATLNENLTPAINLLVEAAEKMTTRQADSNAAAMEQIVGRFVENVGAYAEQQREMMNSSTEEIKHATAGLGGTIGSFIEQVEKQFEAISAGQRNVLASVRETVQRNVSESERVLELGGELANRLTAMGESLAGIGDKLNQSTAHLVTTSRHVESLGLAMETASTSLSSSIRQAYDVTSRYVEETAGLQATISESMDYLQKLEGSSSEYADRVEMTAKTVEDGLATLKNHQEDFLNGMEKNLSAIQAQVADLLNEYGELVTGQTSQRLSEWNNNTQQFCEQMVSAVGAIHDVVQEIDDRLPGQQANRVAHS